MLLGSHCLGLPGCAQLNKRPCPCFLQLTLQIHEAPCWPHAAWSSFSAHLARCLSHDTGADTHTHKCAHGHINTTRDQRRHILTRTQSRTHSVLLRSYIHPHRHSWTCTVSHACTLRYTYTQTCRVIITVVDCIMSPQRLFEVLTPSTWECNLS